MNNDLISKQAVIDIVEKKRMLVGMNDLSAEYKLAEVQEEIERMKTDFDVDNVADKIADKLDDYLFEKYCIEGDTRLIDIIKSAMNQ